MQSFKLLSLCCLTPFARQLHRLFKRSLIATITLTLSGFIGCGGGGVDGPIDFPSENQTPDSFSLTPQTTGEFNQWIESNTITISGITEAIEISVTGGEYRINSAPFTLLPGTVSAGQTVTVRVRSAERAGVVRTAYLSVGGILSGLIRGFQVTTIAPLALEAAFPQLPALSGLVGLYQTPGDTSRWYAVLQSGVVLWFDNNPAASSLNTYVDLTSKVQSGGERGLLGLAFHPQFDSNGEVYFSYTNTQGDSVISRIVDEGTAPLDIAAENIILTTSQPASNHNGGHIAFGPDGYLYIGLGDGGGSGDTYGNGQNTQTLLGSLLRIDVSGADYTNPPDNPFAADPDVLDEIYAYGLRNPWRWSFDTQTAELWLGDVGQGSWEEIDKVSAGDNLGWPIMEGNHCFASTNCNTANLTVPVAEYDHDRGDCSVTGGFVYRGQEMSFLTGLYLFADFCTGRLFSASEQPDESYLVQEILLSGLNISSFAQGNDGELFVLDHSGSIGAGIFQIIEQSDLAQQ